MTSFALTRPTPAGLTKSFDDSPMSLFLDVDGTLLDLAERPSEVTAPAGLVETLAKAERKLDGALALVSGRPIEELDRLFDPLRLRAAGVHGAEMRFEPYAPPVSSSGAKELPGSLWTALAEVLARFPGAFAENKRFSFAVHYRLATDIEAPLREAVMRLVEVESRIPIEVLNAHCAIELRAPGFDKGRAVEAFLAAPPFLGRTPIFVGDDTTDEAGFSVVSARGGFAYSVGERRPGAIGAFARPAEVREWLMAFAEGRVTA
jgi:trehalose 6-phosphate phosphatase